MADTTQGAADAAQKTADTTPKPVSRWCWLAVAVLAIITVGTLYGLFAIWPASAETVAAQNPPAQKAAPNGAKATSPGPPNPGANSSDPAPASGGSTPSYAAPASPGSKSSDPAPASPDTTSPGATPANPPATAAAATADRCIPDGIWFFFFDKPCNQETRLLWITFLAGIMGSLIYAWNSLTTFVGNRTYVSSWTLWYCVRAVMGGMLALLFYVVVRGGFLGLSVQSGQLNIYSFAALGALSGMFSKRATDKLEEVFAALFTTQKGDTERKDKAFPDKPKPSSEGSGGGAGAPASPTPGGPPALSPDTLKVGSAGDITLTAAGITEHSTVLIDGLLHGSKFQEPGKLTFRLTAEETDSARDMSIAVSLDGAAEHASPPAVLHIQA